MEMDDVCLCQCVRRTCEPKRGQAWADLPGGLCSCCCCGWSWSCISVRTDADVSPEGVHALSTPFSLHIFCAKTLQRGAGPTSAGNWNKGFRQRFDPFPFPSRHQTYLPRLSSHVNDTQAVTVRFHNLELAPLLVTCPLSPPLRALGHTEGNQFCRVTVGSANAVKTGLCLLAGSQGESGCGLTGQLLPQTTAQSLSAILISFSNLPVSDTRLNNDRWMTDRLQAARPCGP
ncbi:hypothetical protein B0H66DRAFT_65074 [Apodospora peruviana]|uniref:Uncharacterized protein n=1 Tax=Apodospora peruviana TaxID=516989 RepID=A0AAE0ISJ2_9PEZI|nr:hypothetical protein B0H66DRAFT_65074 [Apodospora peruviana]